MRNYTTEQINDITKREQKCLEFLKKNNMTPSCQIQKIAIGNDIFADKLTPFLQDLKYQNESITENKKSD